MGGVGSKDITPKMNVIDQMEFELAYFKARVQHFNHYTLSERERKSYHLKFFCPNQMFIWFFLLYFSWIHYLQVLKVDININ